MSIILRKEYGGLIASGTSILEGSLYYNAYGSDSFLIYNLIIVILGFINWLGVKNMDKTFSSKYASKKRSRTYDPSKPKTVIHVDQEHLKDQATESPHKICSNCQQVVESKVNYCKNCEGKTDNGDKCDCCDIWNPPLRERIAEPNKNGDYICIDCGDLDV